MNEDDDVEYVAGGTLSKGEVAERLDRWQRIAERAARRTPEGKGDAVSPGHYKGFSNDAEVIDITEALNLNGGSAVKYIARSTRLDGQNKGNIVEDLRKARWHIDREISRIEACHE